MSEISRRHLLAGTGALAAAAAVPAAAQSTGLAAAEARSLAGKSFLITGTSSGFGRLGALHYARLGARVFATMRNLPRPEAEELSKIARDEKLDLHVLPLDVLSEEQVNAAVAEAEKRNGGPLDVLVNNAGIFRVMPTVFTSEADYRQIIDINQVGTFLGMKAVIPTMVAAESGSIINISSVAGLQGAPGTMAYSASKWAVRGMTKVAAKEVAPFGVRVNSVHPGIIDTPMMSEASPEGTVVERVVQAIPMGHVAQADDVARLVLYLASDESSYSTGSEFVVDGGMTA